VFFSKTKREKKKPPLLKPAWTRLALITGGSNLRLPQNAPKQPGKPGWLSLDRPAWRHAVT
jgi:hypothetical protein